MYSRMKVAMPYETQNDATVSWPALMPPSLGSSGRSGGDTVSTSAIMLPNPTKNIRRWPLRKAWNGIRANGMAV
ncbi:hypothetical protein ColKHC_07164 [Colletotrichum higginsianum]|nr:hypothetical protein ColKHC_07164 [Colletotrichum higginsianum]